MATLSPTEPKHRIVILDILRGFALLGIIFNNMLYFSGYAFMPFEDIQKILDFQLNEKIYDFLDIVITGKFYTLFSILFAVGFFIQFNKYKDDSTSFLKTYRRRLFILLIIGLIHSLIWYGDILLTYSIIAFVLIFFRNVKTKNLLRWSLFFILFPLLLDLAILPFSHYLNSVSPASGTPTAHVEYPDMPASVVIDTFKNGSITEIFLLNIHSTVWKYLGFFVSGRWFTLLGIFLLGYYLALTGFFTRKSQSKPLFILSLSIGLLATISAKILGGNALQFPPTLSNIVYKFLLVTGQIFLCLFYIMAIVKIYRGSMGKRVLNLLIPMGRMALSNYLLQTILMIIVFYNFGFNLIGKLGLFPVMAIAIAVLGMQVVFSKIWLRHFRFGPFEWLWRRLTYMKKVELKYKNT